MADISTLAPNTTLPTNDVTPEQDTSIQNQTEDTELLQETQDDDFSFDELDEELIIEDFTIDGICGVY